MLDTLRARLTLWYSFVLALLLVLFSLISYFLFSRATDRRTDADLTELAYSFLVTFQDELKDPDNPGGLQTAARQVMLEHLVRGDIVLIVDPAGKIIASSADLLPSNSSADAAAARAVASDDLQRFLELPSQSDRKFQTMAGNKGGFRAYATRFSAGGQTWGLVVLRSMHPQLEMLEQIRLAFAWLIPLGVFFAGVGGYFLARKSLAPVAVMGVQAQRISASNLHDRLEVKNANDELGRLACTFNELLDRLDQSFGRQRRFISDASHELRTPISILRGEAEVALSQPSRPSEEYRESLAVLHQEAERLSRIVEDLFTLTRADADEYQLSRTDFYLDELVTDCVRSARALASAKTITLAAEPLQEMPIRADEDLLRRLILNLVDNAIKYTAPGGNVSVACRSMPGGYELSVADSGPGIPAAMQSRIFDRFFRADLARSRTEKNGGAGLGLSIARWIAEAHSGHIELRSSGPKGSIFTVNIPAADKSSST